MWQVKIDELRLLSTEHLSWLLEIDHHPILILVICPLSELEAMTLTSTLPLSMPQDTKPLSSPKVEELREQIDKVVNIMQSNVEKMAERGESLAVLSSKTSRHLPINASVA